MTTTLTIRLSTQHRDALKRRADALNKTESALIRELVEREISQVSPAALVEKWAGALDSKSAGITRRSHPLKQQLRERNWRR